MRFVALVLAALVAAGCSKKDEPAGAAGPDAAGSGAPTPSATSATALGAASPPSPAVLSSEFFAFGPVPKKGSSLLLAERTGSQLRALYSGIHRRDVTMVGTMTDATHFTLHEAKAAKGAPPLTISGEVVKGKSLSATVKDEVAGKTTAIEGAPLHLAAQKPVAIPGPVEKDAELGGLLGKLPIRMKLAKKGPQLEGIYRYAKSKSDLRLSGKVEDDGSFALTETAGGKTTGSFRGIYLAPTSLFGRWTSPDGAKSFPVVLHQEGGYPETVTFDDQVVVYPEETSFQGKRCRASSVVAHIRGIPDKAKENATNAWLTKLFTYSVAPGEKLEATKCEEPPDDMPELPDFDESISYKLNTTKGRFVSLTALSYSFAGGAHGSSSAQCEILDTKTFKHFRLGDYLTETGRKTLAKKATEAIRKEQAQYATFKSLTELGFGSDAFEVGKDTNVCLYDSEVAVEFSPYELGAYSLGAPDARFPKAEVQALFESNDLTKAIFP